MNTKFKSIKRNFKYLMVILSIITLVSSFIPDFVFANGIEQPVQESEESINETVNPIEQAIDGLEESIDEIDESNEQSIDELEEIFNDVSEPINQSVNEQEKPINEIIEQNEEISKEPEIEKSIDEIIKSKELYNFRSETDRDKLLKEYVPDIINRVDDLSHNRMQLFSSSVSAYGIPPELNVRATYRFPPGYVSGFGPQSSDYTIYSYLPKARNSGTYNSTTSLMLWCIEPIDLFSGGSNTGYSRITQSEKKYHDASVVAYWGYESKKNTGNQTANLKRAFMTEMYIQEIVTGVQVINISGAVSQSEYNTFKSSMSEEIRKYNNLPSVRNNTITLGVGSVTLTDSNNSINRYKVTNNSANVGVSISGNKITITPNQNTKNGTVRLQYDVPSSYHRNPARFTHSTRTQQELMDMGFGDPHSITLNIQATGDLEIVKQSSDASVLKNSSYTLQGAEFLVTGPNSFRRTVTTNSQGKVTLTGIPSGTYTVKETKAPRGFTLNSTAQSTTIAGNKKTVTIRNTPIKPKITVRHRDIHNNADLEPAQSYTRLIGENYSFNPKSRITTNNGNNVYLPTSTKPITGTVPTGGRTITFYYDLTRNITVNHIDNRDKKVLSTKTETKRRGVSYSYSHRTDLKKGSYTYRPLSTAKQTGTVGGSHINLNFYYDVPLVKTGLQKIQIFTAPSYEGLPVIVDLIKESIYPNSLGDMGTKKIDVVLYKESTKIETKTYTAKDLPTQIKFTVPPAYLEKDEVDLYRVALEGFDKNDFDVPNDRLQISTEGYTSAERTIIADSKGAESSMQYQGVIMTEREVNKEMEKYYETLTLSLNAIQPIKSGYGFELVQDLKYQNELSSEANVSNQFEVILDSRVVDGSFYSRNGSKAIIPLEVNETKMGNEHVKQFDFPNVYVESKTGTIKKYGNPSNTKDGGNKVYVPIWIDELGDYDYTFRSVNPLGVNAVQVLINDTVDVYAYMFAHIGSETLDLDEILIEPANLNNPFPNGLPDGWTTSDLEWLQAN